jgi:hypothetical protein
MTTIVTAVKKTVLDPVTVLNILDLVEYPLYTTNEVHNNFPRISTNRPKTFLISLIEDGKVDKVIQVGYGGTVTEIARTAQELDLDVILYRSMA